MLCTENNNKASFQKRVEVITGTHTHTQQSSRIYEYGGLGNDTAADDDDDDTAIYPFNDDATIYPFDDDDDATNNINSHTFFLVCLVLSEESHRSIHHVGGGFGIG